MTQAATQDLTITRGDTETVIATMTDGTSNIAVAGRTYAAQLRSSPDSTTIGATMTCTGSDSPTVGVVTCVLSATDSALLTPGYYYWDLQETVTATGVVSTVLAGLVTVLADVTRL